VNSKTDDDTNDPPAASVARQRLTIVVHALHGGGAERMAALMANLWARDGKQVTLITLDAVTTDDYAVDEAVARVGLGVMARSRGVLSAIWKNWRRVRSLRRAIRESRPDAVVAVGDKTNVLTVLACLGMKVGVFLNEQIDFRRHDVGRAWSTLRRWTYRRCTALVVLSKQLLQPGRELTRGRPVFVIPNAIDPKAEGGRRKAEGRPTNDFPLTTHHSPLTIYGMGRLSEQKGIDLLIEAFSRIAGEFPEWTVQILGEGPLRPQLEQLIADKGLRDRMQLAGWVTDPQRRLASGDLFVLSSRFEGFPLALVEAMAVGLPAVSFDCPTGPSEIVRHEIDGLLVPPEDADALAAAMKRLMRDESTRREFAQRAPEVLDRFGTARFLKDWNLVIGGVSEEDFATSLAQPSGNADSAGPADSRGSG